MTDESGISTTLAPPSSRSSFSGPPLSGPPLERVQKPWGEELILDRNGDTVIKVLRIRARRRLSLQFHRRKHESLMLLSGDALLTVGARIDQLGEVALRIGSHWEIAASVIHRLSAGARGADILEIASRLPDDEEDIVRLADDYGRADISQRV